MRFYIETFADCYVHQIPIETISSQTSVADLRRMIVELYNKNFCTQLTADQTYLLHKGELLLNDKSTLNQCKIRPNETIQFFTRTPKNKPVESAAADFSVRNRPIKILRLDTSPVDQIQAGKSNGKLKAPLQSLADYKQQSPASADSPAPAAIMAPPRHYLDRLKPGDMVEVRDPGTDAWWESKIVEIEVYPPDSFEAVIHYTGYEDSDMVHSLDRIKPVADIAIESAKQVEPGMQVLANWNPKKPERVGWWFKALVINVDEKNGVLVEIRRSLPAKGKKRQPQLLVDRVVVPFADQPEDCRLFMFETFSVTVSPQPSSRPSVSTAELSSSPSSPETLTVLAVAASAAELGILSKLFSPSLPPLSAPSTNEK